MRTLIGMMCFNSVVVTDIKKTNILALCVVAASSASFSLSLFLFSSLESVENTSLSLSAFHQNTNKRGLKFVISANPQTDLRSDWKDRILTVVSPGFPLGLTHRPLCFMLTVSLYFQSRCCLNLADCCHKWTSVPGGGPRTWCAPHWVISYSEERIQC